MAAKKGAKRSAKKGAKRAGGAGPRQQKVGAPALYRHTRAHNAMESLQGCFGQLLSKWSEQAGSTLAMHKGILTNDNYSGSQIVRDLLAETIGWYNTLYETACLMLGGGQSK